MDPSIGLALVSPNGLDLATAVEFNHVTHLQHSAGLIVDLDQNLTSDCGGCGCNMHGNDINVDVLDRVENAWIERIW